MKKFLVAFMLALLLLTGCATKVAETQTSAQQAYGAGAKHCTYRWQTYAWSGHAWSSKANLLQHNEWGKSIKVNNSVLDSTSEVPVSFLKAHKVQGIILYVPGAGGSWKWPSVAYVKSLRANGIKVGWVWEAGATSMTAGKSAGAAAARTFLAASKGYGIPAGTPCYFADDSDTSGAAVSAFLDGASSVLGIQRVGLYAGIVPINYNHKLTATSYDYDVNEVKTADWGQERASQPTPAPKPKPTPVPASFTPYRAKVLRVTQLWNATISTKRKPSPGKSGVVWVDSSKVLVKHGKKYNHIHWGSNPGGGWVLAADLRRI